MHETDEFIRLFMKPPTGSSPKEVQERILYWIERANNPHLYIAPDTVPEDRKRALASVRRKARQNAKRIANRNTVVRDFLIRERQREVA